MNNKVFDDGDLQVYEKEGKFYLRYDAGSHQISMREDEISPDEAEQIMRDPESATKVLFNIQKRLTLAGVKPFVSNI